MRPLVMACLVFTACGPGALDLPICRTGDQPELTIGEGRGEFRAREDGETIGLVHGHQGGFHLELGLQATHIDASDYLKGKIVVRIDDEERVRTRPWLDFECTEEGLQSWGTLLIFNEGDHTTLNGLMVDIEAGVTDTTGLEITAMKRLKIRDLGH